MPSETAGKPRCDTGSRRLLGIAFFSALSASWPHRSQRLAGRVVSPAARSAFPHAGCGAAAPPAIARASRRARASRCSAPPASPVVTLADARGGGAERIQRDDCVRVSRARLRHRACASAALLPGRSTAATSASPALRAALADSPCPASPESTVAMLADARAGRARRFPLAVPCQTPWECRNREPPHDPESLFNLRVADARQRDAPASPVAATAVARADRDERLYRIECAAISRSPSASRWRASASLRPDAVLRQRPHRWRFAPRSGLAVLGPSGFAGRRAR